MRQLQIMCLTVLFSVFTCAALTAQNQNTNYIYELMERKDLPLQTIKKMADNHFSLVGKEKGTGHNHFMRWWYEQTFHLDENGYIIPSDVEAARLNEALRSMPSQEGRIAWTELGPINMNVTTSWNPGIGRIRNMTVDPANVNTLYAASDGGGIWKSNDGGSSWQSTTDQYTADYFSTNQVEVDPSSSNIVYGVQRNGRIIKSTDAGSSWSIPYSGSPTTCKRILIHPTSTNILLATSSSGIYRSTNSGASWTLVLSNTTLEDIQVQPGNPSVMFASGNSTQTFWRSTDAGVTWTNITSGISNTGRTLIGTSPSNPSVVYLVQASGSLFGRLYKSTDGGLNFTTTVVGNPANGTNYFGYETNGTGTTGQAGHDMAIAVNPSNSEEVHIAGIICWKSTNGGTSFTATTDWTWNNAFGYNHADVHQLQYFGTVLYSSSDGGVCKSINNGGDWTYLWNGLATRQLYRIACAPTDAGTIGCGAQDNGHAYRLANGNWNQWLGADGMDVAISSTNANVAIAAIQYGGLYRTTNGGSSYSNIADPASGNWVTPLAWHPSNANTVFGGYNGVFKSTDQGSTWTKISGTTISTNMDCLTLAPSDANYIYGSTGSTLYVSSNGGTSWTSYAIGASITSIAVHPTTPTKVYLTTSSSSNNVKLSLDAGATFTNINTGLPAIAARSIAVDDNTDGSIYVGMNSGVYYRDNINPTWIVYGTGLPNVAINELEIHHGGNLLRIATYGRGVWEIPLNTGTPTCSSPASLTTQSITTSGATLSWAATSGATSYTVEYKETVASTWITLPATTSTTTNLTGLNASTSYDWRVNAICSFGASDYSTANFTTLSPCDAPTGLAENSIGNNTATVTWAAVSGASSYTVEYKIATGTTWTVLAATTALSRNLTGLSSGTNYDWRVKTNCSASGSNYAADAFTTTGCTQTTLTFPVNPLTHVGTGSSSTTATLNGGTNISFTVSNLGKKTNGSAASRYIDMVRIEYVNESGTTVVVGTYSGNNQSTVNVSITGPAQSVKVVLYDGYDGNAPSISVNLTSVTYCSPSAPVNGIVEQEITEEIKFEELSIFPNPVKDVLRFKILNVKTDQQTHLSIESADGRKIVNRPLQLWKDNENLNELNLDNIPKGFYILRIGNSVFNQSSRFLKL